MDPIVQTQIISVIFVFLGEIIGALVVDLLGV